MEPIPISRKPNIIPIPNSLLNDPLLANIIPNPGQICIIPIIGSTKRLRVLVTKNQTELQNWIQERAMDYPLPCGYAISSSSKNRNNTLPDTIHLCGVDEYPIIFQIDDKEGDVSAGVRFIRYLLHEYLLFPTTFERFDEQIYDPLQFGQNICLRDYIANGDAPLDEIFSRELNLPLASPTTYFNWKMNPENYSDHQIIYGAMISYGAMKMHQKLFSWPRPPPMRLELLLNQFGDGIKTTRENDEADEEEEEDNEGGADGK